MKGRISLLFAAAAAGGALMVPTTTALADVAPPTLTGEQFLDPAPAVTTACDATGTSTISFSSSGTATGPYPGMYTEVGTVTLGPQTFDVNGTPHGFLLSFDAVFTFHSTVGDVTGTKSLGPITDPGTQFAVGQCANSQGGDSPVELITAIALNSVRYDAEISAPAGEFADHGTSPLVDLQHLTDVNTGF